MTWRVENRGASRRVVVTKNLPGARWVEVLSRADCEIHVSTSRQILSSSEIRAVIGDRCDGVIGQLTEAWNGELFETLQAAGGRVYSNYAVGYDNVRVEEATRCGIAVGNTPGVLTETTAEMAVALTFAAARRVSESERYLRDGKFHGWLPDLFLGKRLWNGTLGVVGAGRIGSAYALMLAPSHQMDVLYWDLEANEALERKFDSLTALYSDVSGGRRTCRKAATLEEVLSRSDVVSLHVPLSPDTRHLINAERLGCMKPDAVLVNTSRGPVVDEQALVEHLRRHPDFRVGLDVFEREPALASGLANLDNAVIVPHIASATVWTRGGMAILAASNVAGVIEGYPLVADLSREELARFLAGEFPEKTPSIVNGDELGLTRDGG